MAAIGNGNENPQLVQGHIIEYRYGYYKDNSFDRLVKPSNNSPGSATTTPRKEQRSAARRQAAYSAASTACVSVSLPDML